MKKVKIMVENEEREEGEGMWKEFFNKGGIKKSNVAINGETE
jgi:hypothetical protein